MPNYYPYHLIYTSFTKGGENITFLALTAQSGAAAEKGKLLN